VSTIPPGRHPNWCRCQGCRRDIARFESGLLKADIAVVAILAAVAGIMWIALAPLRIWHTTGADGQQHPDTATWIAYGIGGAVIMAALMWLSIRATRETPREAAERTRVREALDIAATVKDLPPAEALRPPPVCLHRNAVKVNSGVPGLNLTYRCWCPACETGLPATFRYPCCGGEPGTLPGDGHAYNCPHRER
jgi:hypothetical protein